MNGAKFTMTATGPLFDGRAMQAADPTLTEAVEEVGRFAVATVKSTLASVLRNPTGRYQSRISAQRTRPNLVDVSDQGSVYGPWLEGTSRRNQTTRFKGYASFRRSTEVIDRAATRITDQVVRRNLPRFN